MSCFIKNTLLCAALASACLLPFALQAEPAKPATYGQLAAGPDEQSDKDTYVLTLSSARSVIERALVAAQSANSRNVLQDPSRSDEMETFRKFLLVKPFKETSYGLALASGEEANREEITQIFLMMRDMGQELYPDMFRLVNIVKIEDLPKRLNALLRTFDYLDDYWLEKFRKFDQAFHEFHKYVDEMEANKTTDVFGSEILMISKLGEFARNDMRKTPQFDRLMRALDHHLVAIRNEVLDKLQTDAVALSKFIWNANQSLARTREHFSKQYSFYADVAPLLESFDTLIAQAQDICDVVDICIKEANSDGKTVGKLRMRKDLDPHGALHADDSSVNNGCPAYTRRTRVALEDCKAYYMKAAERINAANRNKPGYKPITWQ